MALNFINHISGLVQYPRNMQLIFGDDPELNKSTFLLKMLILLIKYKFLFYTFLYIF